MFNQRILKTSIAIIPFLAALALAPAAVPAAHAYGQAQWQVAFSGNFNKPATGGTSTSGFWGWCEFGTDADCESTFYGFPATGGASSGVLLHQSIKGSAWSIAAGLCPPPAPAGSCSPPGVTPNDFFITDGSVSISGPSVFPPPPGCTISGQTATCIVPPQTAQCSLSTLACSGSFSIPGGPTIPCTVTPPTPSEQAVACITLTCGVLSQSLPAVQAVGCAVPGQTVTCTPSAGSLACTTAGVTSVTLVCPTSGLVLTCMVPLESGTCTISGQTVTCPIPGAERIGLYGPDTLIPAAPGHYSAAAIFETVGIEVPPGEHVDIQVTQIPS